MHISGILAFPTYLVPVNGSGKLGNVYDVFIATLYGSSQQCVFVQPMSLNHRR